MIRAALLLAAVVFAALPAPGRGAEADLVAPGGCAAPAALAAIGPELARTAVRLGRRQPLTIVAVGSSSTQGVGASQPGLNYPNRLEAELRQRFPLVTFRVVNRGKSGEDVPEELARLDRDVIVEHPDLVIWQIGTNAVLRRDDVGADGELIRRGVGLLKDAGADIVLMDMQYAPRVLSRPGHAVMEQLIAQEAERANIGLFRRFEIMRHWHAVRQETEDRPMIGPDGLHMTDRGYGCLAAELAEALATNWTSKHGIARRPSTESVAGIAGPAQALGAIPPH